MRRFLRTTLSSALLVMASGAVTASLPLQAQNASDTQIPCFIQTKAEFDTWQAQGKIVHEFFPDASANILNTSPCTILNAHLLIFKINDPDPPLLYQTQELFSTSPSQNIAPGQPARFIGQHPACSFQADLSFPNEHFRGQVYVDRNNLCRKVDNANCYEIVVPPVLSPGQESEFIVRMQNTGTSTWQPGIHRLMSTQPYDQSPIGVDRVDLVQPLPPGQPFSFSFRARAPASPGNYTIAYEMGNEQIRQRFGNACRTQLRVIDSCPQTPARYWEEVQRGNIRFRLDRDGTGYYENNTSCTIPVKMFSFKIFADEHQEPFDETAFVDVGPRSSHTFRVRVPACDFQTDLQPFRTLQYLPDGRPLIHGEIFTTQAGRCRAEMDNARCVGIQAPDAAGPGESVQFQVTMQNNGTSTWQRGLHRLMATFPLDQSPFGVNRVELQQDVPPGQDAVFTFTGRAPASPGVYTAAYEMGRESYQRFGSVCQKRITVRAPEADLSIEKAGPSSVERGGELRYTLMVRNRGAVTSRSVILRDRIPENLAFIQASRPGCSVTGGIVECRLNDLPAAGSEEVVLRFRVLPGAACGSSIVNEAGVTSQTPDDVPGNDDVVAAPVTVICPVGCIDVRKVARDAQGDTLFPVPSFTFRVDGSAGAVQSDDGGNARFPGLMPGAYRVTEDSRQGWDLMQVTPLGGNVFVTAGPACAQVMFENKQRATQPTFTIRKDDGRDTAEPGEILTYTITVTNTSTVDAGNVTVIDTFSHFTTFQSASDGGSVSGRRVTWSGLRIGPGLSKTLTLRVKIFEVNTPENPPVAAVRNSVEIPGGPSAEDITAVIVRPPERGCIDVLKEAFDPGGSRLLSVPAFTFTLDTGRSVQNDSGGRARFTDLLPGVYRVGESPLAGWDLTQVIPQTGEVRVESGPACASMIFRNRQRPSTPVLTIAKSDGRDTVNPGETLTYQITVTNISTVDATNVTVRDTLPPEVTVTGIGQGGGRSGQTVTWTGLRIPAGDSVILTLQARVSGTGILPETVLHNRVEIPGGPSAEDTTRVLVTEPQEADLEITKTGPSSVQRGTTAVYTLTVRNIGPDAATNVTVTDPLPAGTTFQASQSDLRCSLQGGNIRCDVGSVVAGAPATLTITLGVPAQSPCQAGSLQNTATVQARETDRNTGNNSSTVTTPLTCPAQTVDLSIEKTGPSSVERGEELRYTLTVRNRGAATSRAVILRDRIPENLAFIQASRPGCTDTGAAVECRLNDIPAAESAEIVLRFNVQNSATCDGTISNTATVTSQTPDGNTSNNQSTASPVTVRCPVGCIDIQKIARDSDGNTITPVPPFSFHLLNSPGTVQNDGGGNARISHLPPGAYRVIEDTIDGWDLIRTTPQNGSVTVVPGPVCARVVFENAQRVITPVLTISKTDNRDSAEPGELLTYTIIVTNTSSVEARNVTVVDTFSTLTTFQSASDGGSVNGQRVTWSGLRIGAGQSKALTLRVRIFDVSIPENPPTQVVRNIAGITGGQSAEDTTIVVVRLQELGCIDIQKETLDLEGNRLPVAPPFTFTLDNGRNVQNDSSGRARFTDLLPGVYRVSEIPLDGWDLVQVTPSSGEVRVNPGTHCTGVVFKNRQRITTTILTISKTDSRETVNPGETLTYQITVGNISNNDATNVTVRDILPLEVTVTDIRQSGIRSGQTVTWSGLRIPAGGNVTLTLQARVLEAGILPGTVLRNRVEIPGGSSAEDTTSVLVTTPQEADLEITKTGPASVQRGTTAAYTLTVRNIGPDAATNVTVIDPLPAGTTFQASQSDLRCSLQGGNIRCDVGTVAVGAPAVLTITLGVPAQSPCQAGSLQNTATVQARETDRNTGNNSSTVTTPLTCPAQTVDLSITKSGPSSVARGASFNYVLTVGNSGPGTATNIVVRDFLPAGLNYNPAGSDSVCRLENSNVVCTVGTLPQGVSRTLTIAVTNTTQEPCTTSTLQNTATVTSDQQDTGSGNNQSTATTSVTCQTTGNVDLSITKSGPSSVREGATLSYTLSVQNTGVATAHDVTITDTIPASLSFLSGSSDSSCFQQSSTIRCNLGAISGGQFRTVSLGLRANFGQCFRATVFNTAFVSSTEADANSSNNQSQTVQTYLDCEDDGDRRYITDYRARRVLIQDYGTSYDRRVTTTQTTRDITSERSISVEKEASPAEAFPGGIVSYYVTVRNTSTVTLHSIRVTDALPAGLVEILDDGGAKSRKGGTLEWNISRLARGATESLRYTARILPTVAPGQTVRNSVRVYGDGASDEDSVSVAVIGELPQTGVFVGSLLPAPPGGSGTAFLRKGGQNSDAHSLFWVILWTSVIGGGVGAGSLVGKRYLGL